MECSVLVGSWLEGVGYRDLDISIEEFFADAVDDPHQSRSRIREVCAKARETTHSVVLLHPVEDDNEGCVGVESVGGSTRVTVVVHPDTGISVGE